MANKIFIDTSGFYALVSSCDKSHQAVQKIIAEALRKGRFFLTTEYVLVETITLIKARNLTHLLPEFFQIVENERNCQIIWSDPEQFSLTRDYLLKCDDQSWSFTDCHSFLLMKQLKLREALTKDRHFEQAGFKVLLA